MDRAFANAVLRQAWERRRPMDALVRQALALLGITEQRFTFLRAQAQNETRGSSRLLVYTPMTVGKRR